VHLISMSANFATADTVYYNSRFLSATKKPTKYSTQHRFILISVLSGKYYMSSDVQVALSSIVNGELNMC
jgi:hypothetical protein